jgi:hypothetical protein
MHLSISGVQRRRALVRAREVWLKAAGVLSLPSILCVGMATQSIDACDEISAQASERIAREVFRCAIGAHYVVLDANAAVLAEGIDPGPVDVG